jgi:hypothetical protein
LNSTLEPQTKTTQTKFDLRARNTDNAKNVADKILEARQALIKAAQLLKLTHEEYSRVFDLIEVFRDFTERKEVNSAANTLAIQTSVP